MLQRMRPRRPSAAMVVAMIALIAAFGGTAAADDAVDFAKSKLLNGSKIKKKSIAGNRLRNNTITGTQVSESKLGKVPSATKADSATNATNATNATTATTATNIADRAVTPGKFGTIPATHVFHSTSQTLGNNATVVLAFDSEEFDTAGLHDPTTNNSRLTAPISGIYAITANIGFTGNNTGERIVRLRKNGTTTIQFDTENAVQGDTHFMGLSDLVQLSAGEYLEVTATQSSGGNLNVFNCSGDACPVFTMDWVAPTS
jgi:hypothetical protein